MKPTSDERREVVARLRDMAPGSDWPNYVAEACGMDVSKMSNNFHTFTEQLCLRLADLIEPEGRTCERGIEMFSHAYPNEIVCDSDCVSTYVFPLTCGHEVELLENKWPSYCPHCGARVVADA